MDLKWLEEQVKQGRKDADIAAECGLPVHQVGYYRRTGLKVDKSPETRRKWDISREWLVEQVALGRSDKDIAAEKGMTISAVGQYRRRMKVPPRPAAERVKAALLEKYPN